MPIIAALGILEINLSDIISSEQGKLEANGLFERIISFLSILLVFSCVGWALSFIELYEVYQGLISGRDAPDPKAIANNISNALTPYVTFLILAIPGWACAMIVLIFSSYRSRIYFVFWAFSSFVLLVGFPIGTLFGLILGITLYVKRRQFASHA